MTFADAIVENARLTRRQAEILKRMRDGWDGDDGHDAELVYDGGRTAWLGCNRVASRTVFAFLRMCAISSDPVGSTEYYRINGTGREILARHEARK
jgi:hypothetical protein